MSIELHKQMSIPELISAVRMTMLRLRYSSATLCYMTVYGKILQNIAIGKISQYLMRLLVTVLH